MRIGHWSVLVASLVGISSHAADPTAVVTSVTGTPFAEYTDTSTVVGVGAVNADVLYYIDEMSGPLGKSWYVFYEPQPIGKLSATITFDSPITSIVTTGVGLLATNGYGAPGIQYGSAQATGLEGEPQDFFSISGNTLTISWLAYDPGDHIRVFTSTVPEPATWALLAGGLLAVGYVARRRRA